MFKKWFVALVLFLGVVGLTRAARALEDVPVVDPVTQALSVFTTWKTAGPLAGGIALVVLLTQVVKAFVPETFAWKRLIVVLLAVLYSIGLGLMTPGMTPLTVVIAVLITGGGAMALYESIKGAVKTVTGS
jgi:hypothetical protein